MDYKELNDNELLYMCAEENEEAVNLLIKKYKNMILSILKDYMKEYNIIGIDTADLYQEGLIGLIHAINTFDKSKDILFFTYASACIKTSIISAIRQTFRQKNRILNNSYSLDKIFDDSATNLYEVLKDETNEPNKILLDKENELELVNNIKEKLSEKEKTIFELRIDGLKNKEICELLSLDKKDVENTLFRIKKKYREILKKMY